MNKICLLSGFQIHLFSLFNYVFSNEQLIISFRPAFFLAKSHFNLWLILLIKIGQQKKLTLKQNLIVNKLQLLIKLFLFLWKTFRAKNHEDIWKAWFFITPNLYTTPWTMQLMLQWPTGRRVQQQVIGKLILDWLSVLIYWHWKNLSK